MKQQRAWAHNKNKQVSKPFERILIFFVDFETSANIRNGNKPTFFFLDIFPYCDNKIVIVSLLCTMYYIRYYIRLIRETMNK